MGLESIYQPGRSSEVKRNPKMSLLFCWLERGGRWGSSPSTSPSDHQKLKVIQKWAFYFFRYRMVADGVWVHQPAGQSSEVECNPKMSILFFSWRTVADGVRVHQPAGQSSGFECNPKMSILFFWLEKGGGWGSSPSTSPANHRKLNIIQKWAFHFFGCRGVVNGVWVHQPALPIIRSWT